MGAEINRLVSGEPTANGAPMNAMFPSGGGRNGYSAVQPFVEADVDGDIEMEEARLHRRILSESVYVSHLMKRTRSRRPGELARLYLGVLNVYTALPQFIGTFVSWIVFTLLEPSKNDVNDDDPDHHIWLDMKKNAPNAIAI